MSGLLIAGLAATAAPASEIRVLLQRSEGPLVVVAGGRELRLAPAAGGVALPGGHTVARWRARGQGPFEVAGMRVRGKLDVLRTERGLAVVIEVPLEEYVAGAMAGEMPASWQPAALQAQAVASRTYALHQGQVHRRDPFDVESTTKSQVYAGFEVAEREPAIREAVAATRGEILTWQGAPILAVFHAASGGHTASAQEVWGEDLSYLVATEVDGEDEAPDTYWQVRLSSATVGQALAAAGWPIGAVTGAEVVERSASGRATGVRLRGTLGEAVVGGRQLRNALGESTLKSTLFELRASEQELIFAGSGSGHGVGMSQWAAQAMAREGADYREILARFYPGTRLERGLEGSREAAQAADVASGPGERLAKRGEQQ